MISAKRYTLMFVFSMLLRSVRSYVSCSCKPDTALVHGAPVNFTTRSHVHFSGSTAMLAVQSELKPFWYL